jgi:DNA-directed RNA polymerase subunit H (RpoH/RPB5)
MSSNGIIFILLLIFYSFYSNFNVGPPVSTAGQQDNLPKVPSVKITSPKSGQLVFASITNASNLTNGTSSNNNTLLVSGTATDNADSPCEVSVLLNDVRPYQPATPLGTSGKDDYSNWQFLLTPGYAPIKHGANKITAKLECLKSPVNLTKWYSVSVMGGTQEQLLLQEQQLQKQKLEEERQRQLALREMQLQEQREQLMIERAKANAAKINQTEMFVKIESPEKNQYVPIGPITVSGTSSDDSTTDCQVYVDWNDLKPPQKARAAVLSTNNNNTGLGDGQSGNNYSNWTYTFTKEYHEITNGTNELTAKLDCLAYPNNYTKFYSINVTGVPQEQILRQQQEEQLLQQLMIERAKANAAKINQTEMFVKIESHKPGQHVLRDSNLTISGTSSDNATTDCDVSVVLDSKTPYQQALPVNDSGTNNYSNWTFTFTPSYGTPKGGENEMTSRISCLAYPNNYTKFSSINVTGVPQEGLSLQQQENLLQPQLQPQQQQQTLLQREESQPISISQIPKRPDNSINLLSSRDTS